MVDAAKADSAAYRLMRMVQKPTPARFYCPDTGGAPGM
jgi:hypothetical protein